ncbi:von Willebrand factor type A domain protein [Nonomuraea coxensis DSM 45129]|uniref:von Willebrand factor type A domain protein n=1 Tax=Nonomuraea coxensis DSM 45129 TaxID=1122611 RepID=A0ABX8U0S1_9ACTN|nr:VWA domain-containing protein [Nonomuraea coxensis]QYC41331.1 von Willebrand factor type A domain protein [Nonomuraea coxensis DSM 45129]
MDEVNITLFPERAVVRDDAPSETDLVVEISCRSAAGQTRPQGPMNLCLVIDRSGSMDGPKLATAKKSCADIFRRLGDDDLLTVVVFDDEAQVIVNPQTPRDEVERRLDAITSGGMTNLSLGWYQGLLELQTHMGDSHHNRVFLLSDGQANKGETKRAVFADTATRARDTGITASTIGVGADFQEDLLEAIASASGGRFWYIGDSDIEDIIEEEFEGALTVLLDRPRVALSLPEGVRVSRELNALRKVAQRYRLRPLQGEDLFNFAVRLEIDPQAAADGGFAIGATLFEGEREVAATGLRLTLGDRQQVAASPAHPLVRSTVQQFEAAATHETMLTDLAAGNVTELREMLTAEIARLRDLEASLLRAEDEAWGWAPVRGRREALHIGHHLGTKEAEAVYMELIAPYADAPEVQVFLMKVRKHMRREEHRMRMRRLNTTPWDDETPIILEAIDLADRLADRHPEDAGRIHALRERLREYLAGQ